MRPMTAYSKATASLPLIVEAEALATRLPVLSVSNTLILPHGTVPVMVYTDRDIRVINRALRTNKLIGVVQERPPLNQRLSHSLTYRKRIPVFQTGCVASIQGFQETDEGMLVILQGICRFRIKNKYLTAARLMHEVSYESFHRDTIATNRNSACHKDLVSTLSKNLDLYGDDTETLEELLQSSSNKIITNLAQDPIFSAGEKQALLETKDVDERCSLITTLLEVNQPGTQITLH